ncbi:hypothetical protein [Haloglomus halophilum]|uniref:hypothetical protein n=1 Tax=Haloglomus halophilum TaxID=2962672 RepID=UPI0020CA1CFC|nr:hypothetical protein [Haloglomus halophilum]
MFVELLAVGSLSTAILATGLALLLRPERAIEYQERYAERVAAVGPEENPEYYDQTRADRRDTFLLGGLVLSLVGGALLAFTVYGALFV